PSHQRGRATSLWQAGFLLGGVAGPAVGGPLTDIDPQLPFFVYSAGLLVAGTVALLGLRGVPDDDAPRPPADTAGASVADPDAPVPTVAPDRAALLAALRHPAYLAALVANVGVGWMLFGVRNSLVPLYVVEDLGRSATWAGAGFLVGSVAQGLALLRAGHVADLRGRRPAMILGSAVCTASVALLALPTGLALFLLSMAGFGLGAAFLASAPSAVVGDLSPGRSGKLVAVFQMAADAGAVVGPLVAGWLSDTFSPRVAFGATAAVLLLGLAAALRMPETRGGRPIRATADPA
ncbi:MAG TPA: MFS transporter, partial [Actinomycetales bacterium]|nr:MFS transporter [Actinomycetales bacterium]